jgi:hypothetical protein
MQPLKYFKNKNLQLLGYKILYDINFVVIITALFSVIAEAIIPGFLSAHLSLLRIFLVLFFLILLHGYLGEKLKIEYAQKTSKKSASAALSLMFLFLIIGNSMLKFALWQNLIITLSTIAIAFLLYRTIISPKE